MLALNLNCLITVPSSIMLFPFEDIVNSSQEKSNDSDLYPVQLAVENTLFS